MAKIKRRLDSFLVEKNLAGSRERAKAMIMAGVVFVDDVLVDKAGASIPEGARVEVRGEDIPYVSRGGLKLEGALRDFELDVAGMVCLDIGASTGGFADCLLQHGAKKVFAVDVGYGQLAWKLRRDSRVVAFERTNFRHMKEDALPCPVDLAVIDVSFISLRIVVPAASVFLKPEGKILALVKPQFEVGRGKVGKGGVVRDSSLHREVIDELSAFFDQVGFVSLGVHPSGLLGPKGNREFFALLKRKSP